LVTIKTNRKNSGLYDKISSTKSFEINDVGLRDCEQRLLITLHLKRKEGFLNRMLYDVSLAVTKMTNEKKFEDRFNHAIDLDKTEFTINFLYGYQIRGNDKIYSVSKKSIPGCKRCNIGVTFKPEDNSSLIAYKPKIDINTNRFFTAEYMKISNNSNHLKNTMEAKEGCSVLFKIKSSCKDILTFRIIDCPSIRISQTFWAATAGYFPCGNTNETVIYHSPEEKELSKSPVTLSLYEKCIFTKYDDEKPPCIIDQKKIWLLRRIVMGG
jgi:hypothetical protein